jgi:hypothetical protein
MAQQPIQIPDIDLAKPETVLIRYLLLRNQMRQIDDEISGIITEMQRQMKVAAEKAQAEAREAMAKAKTEQAAAEKSEKSKK